MNSVRRAEARIRARKMGRQGRERNRFLSSFYSVIMIFLLVAGLILVNLIHQEKGFDALVSQIKKRVEPLAIMDVKAWLPFENWFSKKEETLTTSLSTHYSQIEGNYYEALNQQVISLGDGIVLYLGQQASGQVAIVKQDNGILVTYGTLSEVSVMEDDRLLKGQILGLVEDSVFLDFSLEGQSLTLNEALSK